MSAKILKAVISILAFPLLLIIFHKYTPRVSSATNHVVISEIQVGGITATDEFVELYNPTSSPVDMEGWRLTKKTSTGNQSNLVSSISGIIPAHGYFLIAHPDYDGTTTPDLPYSAASNSISGHNSVILYNDAGTTEVDKVGMGTAMDFEGASTGTPQPSTSTERKASSSSTMESMAVGGDDEFLGNGEDTNNNYNDFWARDIPQPQNTNSPTETPGQPAPTPTSGPTPTEGPTPTQSPTPTDTPSPTPEPTETPTPTPAPTQVILISEIQVGGTTSTDEFVELYNPTDSAQDLSGWKIMKKTAAGTENQLVVNLTSGSIASHGYFLAAHTTYDGVPTADVTYSEDVTVSANNTVLLYDNSDNLIDKVGMGSADDFEGSDTASSPANDRSVERKANSESTKTSMETGGTDEFAGNGEDSNDNDLDFILRTISDPQNTSSPTESPGVGPSPTPTPVPTQSPSPTPEPTETPTPTPAPPQVILISEIQIAGTSSTDEFVELYNPNNEPVSLSDWRLTRKTQAGQPENESNLVSSFPEETVIAAHGYYLISHANYDGAPSSDLGYTASTNSIASNNTVLLYSDSGVTLVDKVGMGEAVDSEISTTIVPSVDESVERKASVSSTQESMGPGGSEETAGNGYDTNNNNNDFIQRAASDPQNSTSTSEPSGGAPTPTPTTSPTPEPTESPSPTPTEPTPSPQPTPTPTPGPSSIKRVIGIFLFPGRITVCYLNYEITRFGVFSIFFPRITCERIY